jgi:hypothetical protein
LLGDLKRILCNTENYHPEQGCQMFYFIPKSPFGCTLEGFGMENVDIFNGRLENVTDIRDIL